MADARAQILITAQDRASRTLRKMRNEVGGLSKSVGGLAAQFGLAFGAGAVTSGIINVALQTEKLRASLETVTGSAGAANAAFDQIKRFTAETPFQVNQVADAFIKLSAYGIEPTEDLLRSLGNTASAMGKSLDQAVEALADAATGEFERLKEFGIKASSAGDRVAFTFRGVTTEVGKNADEITAYLQKIGETDFAGAMDRQMDTLGGSFSNLQDAVFNLADEFAKDSGLTDSIKDATSAITEMIGKTDEAAPIVTQFFKGLGTIGAGFQSTLGIGDDVDQVLQRMAVVRKELERVRKVSAGRDGLSPRLAYLEAELSFLENKRKRLQNPDILDNFITGPILDTPAATATGGGRTKTKPRSGKSDAEREAEQFARQLRALQDELDPASAKTRDYLENVALLDRAWRDGQISGERYEELVALLGNDQEAIREAAIEQQRFADSFAALADELDPVTAQTSAYLDKVALLDRAWSDGLISGERYEELMFRLAEGTGKAKDEADKARSLWDELGPTFSSAFEDAIVAGEDLRSVLQGLEQDIIRIVTRKLVTEPLGNAISGMFEGGDLFGSLFGGARASGGPVSAGRAYLVGEQEPELIVPRGAGTVLTAGQTAATMGGSVTVVVNGVSDADSFMRNRKQIARAAGRALSEARI